MEKKGKDIFGPEYVIRVYDPKIGMTGFLVIDNTALGPGKGGVRMTSNITEEEVFRLARTMTWKNALAGIPFGGAKAGIIWPGGSSRLKQAYIQSFARAIQSLLPAKYIAGPDVNTGEKEMKSFVEATGNWITATGKPANYCVEILGEKKRCGIPHEFGSTGFGVAHATAVAASVKGLDLRKSTVAIHGFGNVGTFTYQFLTEMGAKIVALADREGAVFSRDGFDSNVIRALIRGNKPLLPHLKKFSIRPASFWGVQADILIPASVTDVINPSNKHMIKSKIIIEAGNIPMRENIEEELSRKGIMIVPDFVANAGGVISSYAEYQGYSPEKMFELVKNKIIQSTQTVLKESIRRRKNPRSVALELAMKKVREKMEKRKTTFN